MRQDLPWHTSPFVSVADGLVVLVLLWALVSGWAEAFRPACTYASLLRSCCAIAPIPLVGVACPLGAKCWMTMGRTVASAICTTCGETPVFSAVFSMSPVPLRP